MPCRSHSGTAVSGGEETTLSAVAKKAGHRRGAPAPIHVRWTHLRSCLDSEFLGGKISHFFKVSFREGERERSGRQTPLTGSTTPRPSPSLLASQEYLLNLPFESSLDLWIIWKFAI